MSQETERKATDLRFVWIPNQLDKEGRIEKYLPFENGKTLKAYLDETGFEWNEKAVASSSKGIVPPDQIETYIPNGGEEILVLKEIKDPISIIVGIVVAAIAYGAFEAGVMLAIAIGALAAFAVYAATQKPRQPSMGTFGGAAGASLDQSSPTYGWEGVSTVQEVGIPIPIIYGEHKIGGNIINQYVWSDGDKQYLNLLIGLGEGEIEDIDDIYINDNPSDNYSDVDIFKRMGTNDQTTIEGFDELHSLVDVGASIPKATPYTYTTSDSDVEAFELHILFPVGLYKSASNGGMETHKVEYKVEYKLHSAGTWTDLGNTEVSASSRTAVRRIFRKEGLTAGQYDIKVTRLTDDDPDLTYVSDMKLDKVDEIKMDDLSYPNTALLGMKFLASEQLSGGTPNITSIVKGRKVTTYKVMNGEDEVPYEDYYWDSAAQKFKLFEDDTELTWDGETYTTAWTANPVWCVYDLLTSKRYGLGEYITTANIDLTQFVEMAKYCDEKVAKGDSSYEKRFRLDIVIDADRNALDVLVQICACFRAWVFYSGGTVKMRIDKEESPVQLFGSGNIIENTFSQQWKSLKDVPNIIEVQYLDKDKNYEQELIAYIDEAELDAGKPPRKKTIRLFMTETSRAIREARYALLVAKYIHRTVTFKCAIDAIACQAGDVISVSNELPMWGESGRVVSGTTDTVTLDKAVTVEAGTTYKIRLRYADDTVEEKTVTNAAGSHSVITISGNFSQTPAEGDVFAFGETNILKKDFRITQIRKDAKSEIEITAIEYNENVYDDSAPDLPDSNWDDPTYGIPSVRDLAVTERIVKLMDGTIENVLDVWWNKPDISSYPFTSYDYAKVYLSDDDGETYVYKGQSSGGSFSIQGGIIDGVTYKILVATVNKQGTEKNHTLCPTVTITSQGKLAPPSDVTGFAASFANDHIRFSWNHIADPDLNGYEIRELPYAGAAWSLGVPVSVLISDNQFDYFSITTQGNRYFAIKAIDTSDNYSTNQTTATLLIDAIPDINIIETVDFDLTEGTLSGDGERVWTKDYDSDLYRQAIQVVTETLWDDGGDWDDTDIPSWDEPVVTTAATYITETVDLLGVVSPNITIELGIKSESGGQQTLYIAYSDDDDEPTNWTEFAGGVYSGRYFRFKVEFLTTEEDYPITLYKLKALFDVLDVEEQKLNIDVAASGWTTVTFDESFLSVKGLIVSVVGNPYIAEIDQTNLPASFDIKLKDAAGAQQAGKINYYVKGY